MDVVMTLQIVFIFVMFMLNLLCVLLPLKIIPKDPSKLLNRKSQRRISWCGCLSGGVFLGTCYVQLIPYLDKKFTQVFIMAGADVDYISLTTQSTVMAGFFLILLIEQVIEAWQHNKKQNKSTKYKVIKNVNQSNGEDVVEFSDSDVSSDSSLAEESGTGNQNKILSKKPSKDRQSKSTSLMSNSVNHPRKDNTHSHAHSHAHNHAHSHGEELPMGHGHSHILDVVTENHGFRSFLIMSALGIHSLFEGMAVGLQESVMALINLFIGVLLHECLIAFSIGVSLAQQQNKLKRGTIIKLSVMFSLTIPVGMAIGLGIGGMSGFKAELTSAIIQGIAAGTFVYVIFFEILPQEINSNEDRLLKVLFMFIGFVVILLLQFTMTEHH